MVNKCYKIENWMDIKINILLEEIKEEPHLIFPLQIFLHSGAYPFNSPIYEYSQMPFHSLFDN